ncbi:head-tail connector protein [Paremcibacter congregatus]|uniref:head-tail connector protein n=1 Tax=Paremcibacter congregatus TaxID=2043170 RepID=UPI003A929593
MDVVLTTAPEEPLVTLAEAKKQLRVIDGFTDDDTYITGLVSAAESYLDGREGVLGRALVTQTWTGTLDARFPSEIKVPLPPLQAVTSIKYIDQSGVQQTLDASMYDVITNTEPGLIVPAFGQCWPSVRCQRQAIEVVFVAGYGIASEVPKRVHRAVLFLVGHWYTSRVPVNIGNIVNDIPKTFDALIGTSRVWRL